MSYTALARKWRPRKFSEVIGQEHVVAALSNSLKNQRIHHAFLFTGTRGVGKTTLARIFAKALNCENGIHAEPCCQCASCLSIEQGRFVDLIEVDAASRTKVDDTRDLLDNVQYKPTQGRYKVYLIDEVHMLSTHSFNALLKTLEEPPEHVKFLLATTDPKKLPATVLSRCIQFNLKSMDVPLLSQQLQVITRHEKVQAEKNALDIIAKAANGSVRDALSLLDQAIAYSDAKISPSVVREMLGMIEQHYIDDIFHALAAKDATQLMQVAADISQLAVDYKSALDDLLSGFHHISLYLFSPEALSWKGVDMDKMQKFAALFAADELQLYYQIGVQGKRDLAQAPDARSGFEMILLRMLAFAPLDAVDIMSADTSNDAAVSANATNTAVAPPSASTSAPTTASSQISPKTAITRHQSKPAQADVEQNALNAAPAPDAFDAHAHITDAPSSTPESAKHESAQFAKAAETTDKPAPEQSAPSEQDTAAQQTPLREPSQLNDAKQWIEFVNGSKFAGILKQLVMNMVPVKFENGCLSLYLDESCQQLFNPDRQQKIVDGINQTLATPVQLQVEITAIPEQLMTPTKFNQSQQQQVLEDAKHAIVTDEHVQELVNLFDAQIDETSIAPAKHSESTNTQ